jgi:hypothetical protein
MVELTFAGSESKLEKTMIDLGKVTANNVMIGTWPTPEKPAKSNPGRSLMIEITFGGPISKLEKTLISLGKTRTSDVDIGTWPTPE